MCINISARFSAFHNRYIKQLLKFLDVLKWVLVLDLHCSAQITYAKPVELTVSLIFSIDFAETSHNNMLPVLKKLQSLISNPHESVTINL